MKKKFKLQDLDCAICAGKNGRCDQKSRESTMQMSAFMMQKMTVDAEDDKFDAIMEEVVRVCKGRSGLQDPDEIALRELLVTEQFAGINLIPI